MNMPDLKKPSGVIHVDHDLSAPAMRLYNCLLAYCQEEIPEVHNSPFLTVPREMVRDYMHTRNDDKVKEWLRELSTTAVEFNNLGKGGLPSWGFYTFIQEPEFRGSYIRFGMAETLRGLIADSTMFAKINLMLERRFKKTKHALPLYELGLDYRENKDRLTGKGCTPWMKVDDFRKYMGIGPKEYQQFFVLNRDVIQKALKEVKAESDIQMTLEKKLKSRKVAEIRFIVEDNTKNMSPIERLKRIQKTLPGLEGEKAMEQDHYAQFMHNFFDITLGRARKIARLYVGNKEHFEEVAQRIERAKLEGKIKGKLGPYAAAVFERENPRVEIACNSG